MAVLHLLSPRGFRATGLYAGIKTRNAFTSAIDDLKTIAVSRLMLDNVPHIKAYWVMLTAEVATIALNFGADDMDGTVGEERIAHDAGAISPMELAKGKLISIIHEDHVKSQAVAARVGMKFEKAVEFKGFPVRIYSTG